MTIRLADELPPRAATLTWAYSWTFTPYAFTVVGRAPDDAAIQWLEASQTSAPVAIAVPAAARDRAGVAWRYLRLGVTHIVPYGIDHVLFVLGLFLLNVRLRRSSSKSPRSPSRIRSLSPRVPTAPSQSTRPSSNR